MLPGCFSPPVSAREPDQKGQISGTYSTAVIR
jgi:hypothetical protein